MSRPKLPPFARELADARRAGMVPDLGGKWWLVLIGWGAARLVRGSQSTRVVLPLDADPTEYDLRPLADLPLWLVYEAGNEARMFEAADALLAIRPASMWACPLPFDGICSTHWGQGGGGMLSPGAIESGICRDGCYRNEQGQVVADFDRHVLRFPDGRVFRWTGYGWT